jgi:hypothetical protein
MCVSSGPASLPETAASQAGDVAQQGLAISIGTRTLIQNAFTLLKHRALEYVAGL